MVSSRSSRTAAPICSPSPMTRSPSPARPARSERDVDLLLDQLFNGVSLASLYLLASLGLALSFGLMRVINMAHGEMLMLGGYLAWLTLLAVPGAAGILLAIPG